jgi:hypothetical protein
MTKICPQGKIVNPKTGRCVKKDGKIGKEIMRKSRKTTKKSPTRKSPTRKSPSRKSRKTTKKTTTRKSPSRKSRKTTKKTTTRKSPSRKSRKTTRKSPSRKSRKTTRKSPSRKSPKSTLNNLIDEKFVSNITKNSLKLILQNYNALEDTYTISTDAKKSILRFVFTIILKVINLANKKCNNCVITDKHIITVLNSFLDVNCSPPYCIKDQAIKNINETIDISKDMDKLKDIRKVDNLGSIITISKFVENNSKHKVDLSGLVAITNLSLYLFTEIIELSISQASKQERTRISSFHFIRGVFIDWEFQKLIEKHNLISKSLDNTLNSTFKSFDLKPDSKKTKQLISKITYNTLFK